MKTAKSKWVSGSPWHYSPRPGLFLSLGLLDKYSTLLGWLRMRPALLDPFPRCFGDGHGLIVFSMAITGLVTIWKW